MLHRILQLQDIQTLDSELADAVRLEDYRHAAQIKARLAELEQQDVVGAVLQVGSTSTSTREARSLYEGSPWSPYEGC